MITKEMAQKAAEWWADQVCAPTFDGLSAEERQVEKNKPYELAEMMAAMLVKPVETNAREKFITALVDRILKDQPRWLDVDYHPDRLLAEVGEASGIPSMNWPWKTGCYFTEDGKVFASSGYAAPKIEL